MKEKGINQREGLNVRLLGHLSVVSFECDMTICPELYTGNLKETELAHLVVFQSE